MVDKVGQFDRELASPATPGAERLRALQFVLHLVGDLHQPLHCSDDRDAGGNDKRALAAGHRAGSLHHYWDALFVEELGRSPQRVARQLILGITPRQRRLWSAGTAADWALQSFGVAAAVAYGRLPRPDQHGVYELDDRYVEAATAAVRVQLQRAGVRLAWLLNVDLARQGAR